MPPAASVAARHGDAELGTVRLSRRPCGARRACQSPVQRRRVRGDLVVSAAPAGADTPGPPRRPPALAAAGREGAAMLPAFSRTPGDGKPAGPLEAAAQHGADNPPRTALGPDCE